MKENKKILYIDMDNVLVDFQYGLDQIPEDIKKKYKGDEDEIPGIFEKMIPMKGAIEAINKLKDKFDLYILSTATWKNPGAWTHKVEWIQRYFGIEKDSPLHKRIILTHHKNLNKGDFLVDDRDKNGAKEFEGEWIQFGSEKFPDWETVAEYLQKINQD